MRWAKRKYDEAEYSSDEDGWMFLIVTICVAMILFASLSAVNFTNGIKWLANPEFYAIRYLLDAIGG